MKLLKLAIFCSVITLSGCSILSPVPATPPKSYMINTTPSVTTHRHPRTLSVLITQPDTRPIYNTREMAFTNHPYQVAYFGENEWAETPSQMLLPLMVQTLQNTHYFRAVVSPPYVGRYNYLLSTQILKIQQNFMTNPSRLELSVRAQLTDVATNQVKAIKQFDINIPMQDRTPYGGVIAANKATAQFLRELVVFMVQ